MITITYDEFDFLLLIVIFLCVIGTIRLIHMVYIMIKGFRSKLEYYQYSHANWVADHANDGSYRDTSGIVNYIKVKYQTKKGLYMHKVVPQSVFGNNKEPIGIIIYPHNDKKYIYEKKITQWFFPIISLVSLLIILFFIVME